MFKGYIVHCYFSLPECNLFNYSLKPCFGSFLSFYSFFCHKVLSKSLCSNGGIGIYLEDALHALVFKGTDLYAKQPMTSQLVSPLVCTWSTNENMHQNKNILGWDETLISHLELSTPVRLGRLTFLKRIPMCFSGFQCGGHMGQRGCFSLRSSPSVQKRFADMHLEQLRQIRTNGHQYTKRKIQVCMHVIYIYK